MLDVLLSITRRVLPGRIAPRFCEPRGQRVVEFPIVRCAFDYKEVGYPQHTWGLAGQTQCSHALSRLWNI
eukprot:3531680-Amphidinium_carterae.1